VGVAEPPTAGVPPFFWPAAPAFYVKWRVHCAKRKFKFELIMMPRLDAGPHVLVPVSWQILQFVAVFAAAIAVLRVPGSPDLRSPSIPHGRGICCIYQITNNSTYRPWGRESVCAGCLRELLFNFLFNKMQTT